MNASELLERFVGGTGFRTIIVAAHPDDETLWIGNFLADRRYVSFVHLTDGAPRDPYFARMARCKTREEYARLRNEELRSALRVLGLADARRHSLAACDQEAALELTRLTRALSVELDAHGTEVLLTHAYEGGHPDHDAAAFVARAAIARARSKPVLLEFSGYHASDSTEDLMTGFLPGEAPVVTRALSLHEIQRKRLALACFESQREVLSRFPIETESLRVGGRLDFSAPPHRGRLHYETHGWPLSAQIFREAVRTAARSLGVDVVLG